MSTFMPCPTARNAVPMAAVVFPLPGPVFTMMRPRRTSDIEAEFLIVPGWWEYVLPKAAITRFARDEPLQHAGQTVAGVVARRNRDWRVAGHSECSIRLRNAQSRPCTVPRPESCHSAT